MTLIGATTENPYFEVNSALLSRGPDLRAAPARAGGRPPRFWIARFATPSAGSPTRPRSPTRRPRATWPSAPAATRASRSSALERAVETARAAASRGRPRRSLRTRCSARRSAYDREGDHHYDYISAWIKATRGVRPRRLPLLPGGDARGRRGPAVHRPADGDPRLRGHRQRRPAGAWWSRRQRRLAVDRVGLPECRSTSPRRRPTWRWPRSRTPPCRGIQRASRPRARARRAAPAAVPARRPLSRGEEARARGQGYVYPHDEPGGVADQPVLPEGWRASVSTSRRTVASRRSFLAAWRSSGVGSGRASDPSRDRVRT